MNTMWWGYLHSNGTIQVKRWFGDPKDYTDDCENNDFVLQVVPPFEAENQEVALGIIKNRLNRMVELSSAWGEQRRNLCTMSVITR